MSPFYLARSFVIRFIFSTTVYANITKKQVTTLIRSIDIKENRFGFEPEITAKMSKKKVKLIEVPIHYYPRTKEEGKKIKLKDGFRALYCIAKYKIKG